MSVLEMPGYPFVRKDCTGAWTLKEFLLTLLLCSTKLNSTPGYGAGPLFFSLLRNKQDVHSHAGGAINSL